MDRDFEILIFRDYLWLFNGSDSPVIVHGQIQGQTGKGESAGNRRVSHAVPLVFLIKNKYQFTYQQSAETWTETS